MKHLILVFALLGLFASCQENVLENQNEFPETLSMEEMSLLFIKKKITNENTQFADVNMLNELEIEIESFSGKTEFYLLNSATNTYNKVADYSGNTFPEAVTNSSIQARLPEFIADDEPDCIVNEGGLCEIRIYGHYTYSEAVQTCQGLPTETYIMPGPASWNCWLMDGE